MTESTAELFYGSDDSTRGSHGPVLVESVNRLRDFRGINTSDADKLLTETSQFFARAQIPPRHAALLYSNIVDRLQRPLSDDEFSQAQTEARRRVREKYPDDHEERLQIVSDYVGNFPTISQQLKDSGMGSDPALVLALADRAKALRPRVK